MYIYIYIYREREREGRFWWIWQDDKISGKVDKSNTYNGFSSNISFFIQQNITTKSIVSFWFIHLSSK